MEMTEKKSQDYLFLVRELPLQLPTICIGGEVMIPCTVHLAIRAVKYSDKNSVSCVFILTCLNIHKSTPGSGATESNSKKKQLMLKR